MKAVVFYPGASVDLEKAMELFPLHKERLDAFHERGFLLMVGAFADPAADGSMGVFTTREAAEEFVKGDPFVLNGAVEVYVIKDWNETLVE
jgi:uncharacterized protein YciI